MAERCFNNNNVDVDRPSSAKKFRQAGGGRRVKAQEVRLAMFDGFLDIRVCLNPIRIKGRLPKKMFIAKCKDIYGKWLEQQNPPIPLEEQLKFTDTWLDGWMKEYGVSLKGSQTKDSLFPKKIELRDHWNTLFGE